VTSSGRGNYGNFFFIYLFTLPMNTASVGNLSFLNSIVSFITKDSKLLSEHVIK